MPEDIDKSHLRARPLQIQDRRTVLIVGPQDADELFAVSQHDDDFLCMCRAVDTEEKRGQVKTVG